MRRDKHLLSLLCAASVALASGAHAQSPKMKMTTPIPPQITTPDSVETRLGTLRFTHGMPDAATIANPLDYTSMIWAQRERLASIVEAVGADPAIDQLLIFHDTPQELSPEVEPGWRETRGATARPPRADPTRGPRSGRVRAPARPARPPTRSRRAGSRQGTAGRACGASRSARRT